jgi:hypothetical protein
MPHCQLERPVWKASLVVDRRSDVGGRHNKLSPLKWGRHRANGCIPSGKFVKHFLEGRARRGCVCGGVRPSLWPCSGAEGFLDGQRPHFRVWVKIGLGVGGRALRQGGGRKKEVVWVEFWGGRQAEKPNALAVQRAISSRTQYGAIGWGHSLPTRRVPGLVGPCCATPLCCNPATPPGSHSLVHHLRRCKRQQLRRTERHGRHRER